MLVSFELKIRCSTERHIRICNLKKETVLKIFGDTPERHFSHRWDDGWTCIITAKKINSIEKKKLNKFLKNGFYGYEWMIDNIIDHQTTYMKEVEEK